MMHKMAVIEHKTSFQSSHLSSLHFSRCRDKILVFLYVFETHICRLCIVNYREEKMKLEERWPRMKVIQKKGIMRENTKMWLRLPKMYSETLTRNLVLFKQWKKGLKIGGELILKLIIKHMLQWVFLHYSPHLSGMNYFHGSQSLEILKVWPRLKICPKSINFFLCKLCTFCGELVYKFEIFAEFHPLKIFIWRL